MKFGVITFPGSNCDADMQHAISNQLRETVIPLWHKDTDLKGADVIVLPGGFSYGDYLRSGAIAQFSAIMQKVKDFANNGGLVFGVCNGFQILCEAGLLPGTLLHNKNQKFICKNVHIKVKSESALTQGLLSKTLKIPIAHGEGRYFISQEELIKLKENDQILFTYSNVNGEETTEANPNGAMENIAGVCNVNRNVFGMMPHPERACDPKLKNTDGLTLFASLIKHVAQQ